MSLMIFIRLRRERGRLRLRPLDENLVAFMMEKLYNGSEICHEQECL